VLASENFEEVFERAEDEAAKIFEKPLADLDASREVQLEVIQKQYHLRETACKRVDDEMHKLSLQDDLLERERGESIILFQLLEKELRASSKSKKERFERDLQADCRACEKTNDAEFQNSQSRIDRVSKEEKHARTELLPILQSNMKSVTKLNSDSQTLLLNRSGDLTLIEKELDKFFWYQLEVFSSAKRLEKKKKNTESKFGFSKPATRLNILK